jgi:hypothetical protein
VGSRHGEEIIKLLEIFSRLGCGFILKFLRGLNVKVPRQTDVPTGHIAVLLVEINLARGRNQIYRYTRVPCGMR